MDSVHLSNYESKMNKSIDGLEGTSLLDKHPNSRITIRKPQYTRAVSKTGECNVYPTKVSKRHFLKDKFTTLVDLKWRYTLAVFFAGFLASWTIFAILWWLIAYTRGDLEADHLPDRQAATGWRPCVTDISGFTSCFLFSVETQQTTGYGEKRPTEKCPEAVALMCVQNVVGLMVDAFVVGVFFAKLMRPKHRARTIRFSRDAVVVLRGNALCLAFRLGDMRTRSRILEAKIKAQLITQVVHKDNRTVSNFMSKLEVSVDDCETDALLMWPVTVVHRITAGSPLFDLVDFGGRRIAGEVEIVVSLEGTVESTDQKTQARSSYLGEEVLWGRRFESVMSLGGDKPGYKIDYSRFDETVKCDETLEYLERIGRDKCKASN
ncbi:unnamed protein product [Phyllotreta striolata]|uniref:Uncharacterized protein n=1 Tax=Phyllotreta striolata TaxID=444603 RepID=A0A9N9XM36_PHYSR|nr:unnamed protein product [Phyllotreta striolata]